jgi:hypothetical protein
MSSTVRSWRASAAARPGMSLRRAVPAFCVDTGDDASVRQLAAAARDRLGESIACGGGTPGIVRY